MRDDYYEILGVSPQADRCAVKSAYRRLAMQLHPDHNEHDAAAGEKFKLVAEAWHVLGDAERRTDYDAWLERHRKYGRMPELEQMPRHHVRVSSRNAERRSERRVSRHAGRSNGRLRPFLLRRSMRVPMWQYVLMCAMCLCCVVPGITRAMRGIAAERTERTGASLSGRPGESPLPVQEQRKSLQQYVERIRATAESGDPAAQFTYGNLLYNGVAGLEMAPDAAAARAWWGKAAEQGYRPAQRVLDATVHRPAAPVETAEGEQPDASISRERRN